MRCPPFLQANRYGDGVQDARRFQHFAWTPGVGKTLKRIAEAARFGPSALARIGTTSASARQAQRA